MVAKYKDKCLVFQRFCWKTNDAKLLVAEIWSDLAQYVAFKLLTQLEHNLQRCKNDLNTKFPKMQDAFANASYQ